MVCNCGGMMRESNYRTKDGRHFEVRTCPGCGRRAVVIRDPLGAIIETKGYHDVNPQRELL